MFGQLIEMALPRIIGVMIHRREKLTMKEERAKNAFVSKLKSVTSKTKKPVIVAIIGLVGSGKSSVATELSKLIGATIISGDEIRIELRKQGERYERARAIAENVVIELVKKGQNIILDSDFVDGKKRASIREKARKAGVRLVFVCTYADLDVQVGRIITANYRDTADDFFGGASSKWQGNGQSKGAVVKLREMWRRAPLHYRWVNKTGGQWVIKNPPCTVLADIDTTNEQAWKREVAECAKKLIAS
ncbi:MAG: AAA family ATPase [Candidatus Zambryskibacteria bacterium]|nr:AAA family ATPase [Candidatus Zambryskibacteria bacterium]